jgi:hypothetical protein
MKPQFQLAVGDCQPAATQKVLKSPAATQKGLAATIAILPLVEMAAGPYH